MKRAFKKMLRLAVASGLIFSLGSSLAQAMPSGGKILQGSAGATANGVNADIEGTLPNWAPIESMAGARSQRMAGLLACRLVRTDPLPVRYRRNRTGKGSVFLRAAPPLSLGNFHL